MKLFQKFRRFIEESLVREIDDMRWKIGADRGAFIKGWLYERFQQEKASGMAG